MLKVILTGENTTNGKESKIITGSSIIVWPIAILIPDQNPPYLLKAKFANRSGPGEKLQILKQAWFVNPSQPMSL